MHWINIHSLFPNNFELAKTRLDSLIRKLNNDGHYEDYNKVFQEWLPSSPSVEIK